MAYLAPSEFVPKLIEAGESKIMMSTKDTLIRAFMAGAILALAAAFAVTINVQTGQPLAGAPGFRRRWRRCSPSMAGPICSCARPMRV